MKARESLARLDGTGRHVPNHQLLLVPLQQREALRSSSMEGTYATPEQLLLYQMDPREPSSDQDRVNDWREVFNYGKALQIGLSLLHDGLPLSLRLIRALHRTLLHGARGEERRPGEFRLPGSD
jgi:Fic family protein